ncbi:MAG TPA: Crp/Fnr family transcriptional regulator [Candidatus Binatia bacterium]|nr:Crp/Fnr family transcriptional regulator [Candidatus Binatia bacterium]
MVKTTSATRVDAKTLRQLKNLSRLPGPQLERLAAHLTVGTFKKNAIIYNQDDQARLVYLLISGVVRVSYIGYERQTIVSLLSPGEFFGLDSLLPESRQPFRCDAFETSTIGSMKPQIFVETLLGTSYETFLPGFATTLHLNRQSYVHCIRGIGLDVRRRIALELSNLAEHFGSADPRGTMITLAISHETLAAIVGASRQQVTEYLNEFDREKIILREGRRIIVNPRQLRNVIENRP